MTERAVDGSPECAPWKPALAVGEPAGGLKRRRFISALYAAIIATKAGLIIGRSSFMGLLRKKVHARRFWLVPSLTCP